MIIATVFLDKAGWVVHEDLATFNEDNYGFIVPELKSAILRVKAMVGAAPDVAWSREGAEVEKGKRTLLAHPPTRGERLEGLLENGMGERLP
jgi:hypothetical protein